MDDSLRTPAFSGLLPHPPVVVPDVGQERIEQCRATVGACERFARRLVGTSPDRLFLVSPHAPRHRHAFGIYAGTRLGGDLGRFGARSAAVDLPNDAATGLRLVEEVGPSGLSTVSIPESPLDHGAVVPLWFLAHAGWAGPTSVVALPAWPTARVLRNFGSAVARALAAVGGRAAFVASGDMTHRATPGAPAGYDPRAVDFDREVTELIGAGRLDDLAEIDFSLRDVAAEDVVDSSLVVAAAHGGRAHGQEVLSYEHPFGVGYLVAVFHDGGEG